jgi:hypothetical protein
MAQAAFGDELLGGGLWSAFAFLLAAFSHNNK